MKKFTTVHPRACGERFVQPRKLTLSGGSSPRVRGTEPTEALVAPMARFIPARAGNGHDSDHNSSLDAVHPRACGERAPLSQALGVGLGSSPRVRGTVS